MALAPADKARQNAARLKVHMDREFEDGHTRRAVAMRETYHDLLRFHARHSDHLRPCDSEPAV